MRMRDSLLRKPEVEDEAEDHQEAEGQGAEGLVEILVGLGMILAIIVGRVVIMLGIAENHQGVTRETGLGGKEHHVSQSMMEDALSAMKRATRKWTVLRDVEVGVHTGAVESLDLVAHLYVKVVDLGADLRLVIVVESNIAIKDPTRGRLHQVGKTEDHEAGKRKSQSQTASPNPLVVGIRTEVHLDVAGKIQCQDRNLIDVMTPEDPNLKVGGQMAMKGADLQNPNPIASTREAVVGLGQTAKTMTNVIPDRTQ